MPPVAHAKPILVPSPSEDEAEKAYAWLAKRGITRSTAVKAGIIGGSQFIDGQQQEVIGFPYRNTAGTYAVKWRSIRSKAFTQTGSANTLWLGEDLKKGDPLVITEGEADALALIQAGVSAVSVPNGAVQPNIQPRAIPFDVAGSDKKFGYIWAAKELIESAPKIILAIDGDEPGQALAEEISRRVGRAKCWNVLWPDGCKDANGVLVAHGPEVLKDCIDNATPWPVKGLYDADHFSAQVEDLYAKGLGKGESTGFPNVDELYTVMPGQLCIVTGVPSMGKSSFIDQIMVNLAKAKGWRFAVCSFENEPRVHIAKLCALYMGKPFFDGLTPRMTRDELQVARAWVNEHFYFLFQGDGAQSPIEDIIDRLRSAVMRYGIRGAIIDPANFVDRERDSSETDWVSHALTKIKVFAMAHDVHMWFVAHPFKMRRGEDGRYTVPGGYEISGSAHWFNKADMGLSVHRPDFLSTVSEIHVWKARYNWVGKPGKTGLVFDSPTGRYSTSIPMPPIKPWDIEV